ncbi:MAG TPA: LysR family transcriptional regulator, partial [Conexibacter sp.]|nr:LysR family transcriptional regulator [Conexibacter sp.]
MTTPATRTLVRSPELAELRAFCAAVELASIGAAAREMQVSQPALSKRLRVLEAVAGTPLLERSTQGVVPTASGGELYRRAQRLLRDADAVDALMRGFVAAAPPVRVAASPTLAEAWLPQALVAFEASHERRLSVEVVAGNSAFVRTLVRSGGADLGLAAVDPGAARDERVRETVVCEDELVVALPPAHPWAAQREIDPAQLAQTPLIQRDPGAHSARTLEA